MMVTDKIILVITIYVISQSIDGVMICNNKNKSSTINEESDYKSFVLVYTLIFEG